MDHECEKEAELERLRGEQARLSLRDDFTTEILGRMEKTVEEIRGYMGRQTESMAIMARQDERILSMQREVKEGRRLIEVLFERLRKHEIQPGEESREDGRKIRTGALQTIVNAVITAAISAMTALAVLAKSGRLAP